MNHAHLESRTKNFCEVWFSQWNISTNKNMSLLITYIIILALHSILCAWSINNNVFKKRTFFITMKKFWIEFPFWSLQIANGSFSELKSHRFCSSHHLYELRDTAVILQQKIIDFFMRKFRVPSLRSYCTDSAKISMQSSREEYLRNKTSLKPSGIWNNHNTFFLSSTCVWKLVA